MLPRGELRDIGQARRPEHTVCRVLNAGSELILQQDHRLQAEEVGLVSI